MRFCSRGNHFCANATFVNSENACNQCWYARLLRERPEAVSLIEFERVIGNRSVQFQVRKAQPVVVKRVTKHGTQEADMQLLAQRQSSGVLPLLESATVTRDSVIMVFPYVDRLKFRELCSSRMLPSYFRSLCYVLRNLHALGFIHGDVKPDNILVSRHSGRFFLADYGWSRSMASIRDPSSAAVGGTAGFRAPEMLFGRKCLTTACDMWAVGITLLSFLRGRHPGPFSDKEEERRFVASVLHKAQLGERSLLDGGRRGSTAALSLLKGLLCEEGDMRLTAANCLAHPFLSTNS